MTNLKGILVMVVLVFCLFWPALSSAQVPEQLIVIYPAVEPQQDSLALSVFFIITDADGRPISRASIDSVEIELLGGDNSPTPASYEDPQTPFFIALLLDASGSMVNVMPDVREAAQEAIDNAPPTARFGVFKFNELALEQELRPIEDFTPDQVLVKGAIAAIDADPNSPTCLYNTVYQAVEILDEQTQEPQERQAVILFTDGKDERADGSRCSQRQYTDVINRATRSAPITPIHTIGLCADASCSNINQNELRTMALETSAFSAVGDKNGLRELFGEIMDGLSSQLVAHANVFPKQGENQAALIVKMDEDQPSLTATFNFFSDRDYNVPPPSPEAQITSLIYDEDQDVYQLAVSVTSPEQLDRVVVEVWDEKIGTLVPPEQNFENPAPTFQFERNTDGLQAGREYSFRVKAVDKEGFLIETEDEETILDMKEFVYEPPQVETVPFTIESVNVDFENALMSIDLKVLDKGQINSYEGFIIDQDTGSRVHTFSQTLLPETGRIEETLPQLMQQAEGPRSYVVTLYLQTKDDRTLETDPYEFKTVPPEPPGLFLSIWLGLINNPAITISILFIIILVTLLIIYWRRPKPKEPLPAPMARPPVDHTVIGIPQAGPARQPARQPAQSTPPRQARFRLKVLQSADQAQQRDAMITRFPFFIGRDGCDFNIPGDRRVSRRHAEISMRGDQLFLTDLGSSNGTFIGDKKLQPQTPVPLNGPVDVRLGRQTLLKIEPA